MADVIFVAVIGAFFALSVVYVRWCDRIIGSDAIVSAATVSAATCDERDVDAAPGVSTGASA